MSEGNFNPSSQVFQCPSADESSPHREDRSDAPKNTNGKRSLDDLQEDQVDVPRKSARLEVDHLSGGDEIPRPSNPVAGTSNPSQKHEFVDGPGHIVFIEERGKRCPALCFNDLLLSKFTDISIISREVRERDKEIRKAEVELEKIKSSSQTASIEKVKRIMEEAIKTQKDLEADIPELVDAQQRCDSLARENQSSKIDLDNSKEIARYMIEDILDRGNLLDISNFKPRQSTEVKEDHSANPAPMPKIVHDAETSKVPERSPVSSTTGPETPIKAEEQFTLRQLALRHLRFAAEELDYCKGHFDFMQEEYAQGVAAERKYRREQYPNRPESFTQTDLDLECLQKKQIVTREVIEAEEAYDRAEQDAESLGLGDILADPHACYWGEIHNDFPSRTPKNSSMPLSDRLRIEAWMASIPDSAAVGPQVVEVAESVEVDTWEAKSVEVFESVSLVAYDMYRKKIDKWQELSSHLRQAEAKRPLPRTVRQNPRRRGRGRQAISSHLNLS